MLTIKEKRERKREIARSRELKSFITKTKASPAPLVVPSEKEVREIFLRCRAEFVYVVRRLGVLNQNPDRHHLGISDLEKIKAEILRAYPDIAADLLPSDLCPTRLEI
jgi:hypothetical protein